MDIYVKKAIIHQFGPSDTDLLLADKYLNITPKIEEYLRKKIERVIQMRPKRVFLPKIMSFYHILQKTF